MLRSSRPSIRAGIFQNLTRVLADRGVSADDLCASMQLPLRVWETVDRLDLDVAGQLLERTAEATGDASFGLRFARHVPVGASGVLGQLQAVAPTVRNLIEATATYSDLAISGLDVEWREEDDAGTISGSFPRGDGGQRRQLEDLVVALLVDRIRIGTGASWHPQLVALTAPRPDGNDRSYRTAFGPNIVFAARRFSVVIEAAALDRTLTPPALGLYSTVLEAAEEQLAQFIEVSDFVGETRRTIQRIMAGEGPISLERVADALGVSSRALQWRLEREATSFEEVLNEVRKAAAIADLAVPGLSMAEISGRLGFSEPSAFTRWAVRTLGATPSAYRRKLLGGNAE